MKTKTVTIGGSWTPRRRGKRYCSPACGFGCTYAQYQKAKKRAAALAAQLNQKGAGWKPRVWENHGGWFYSAVLGDFDVQVYPPHLGGKEFWCSVHCPRAGQHSAYGRTPMEAVRKSLQEVRDTLDAARELEGLLDLAVNGQAR